MELVFAGLHILEAVGLVDRSVPRVPGAAVLQLHLQVDDDLAYVVSQGTISRGGRPGFSLG